jgi:hypothetical protein
MNRHMRHVKRQQTRHSMAASVRARETGDKQG